jgi:Heparinase II/III-like protein
VALTKTYSEEATRAAREGRFWVLDREIELRPPVRWDRDEPRSWLVHLHSWFFMDVLLKATRAGDGGALGQAVELAVDWLASNRRSALSDNRDPAWNNKVVGDRAGYLGYLTRLALARGVGDEAAAALIAAVQEHGEILADDANYAFGGNHGLYQDAGLLRLAAYAAPLLPVAADWGGHALNRLRESLRTLTHPDEAVLLEHSTRYHVAAVNLLRRVDRETPLSDPEIDTLTDRMTAVGGWLVAPDGRLAQIGDTPHGPAPEWAAEAAAKTNGMNVLPGTGWAIVRDGGSYLFVTAAAHGEGHKHADDLSFELYDRGERVVADAGLYAYDAQDPNRVHARSVWAHNGLVIDQQPVPVRVAYGSGISRWGHGAGFHGVELRNPLAARQQAEHRRWFLYRPGELLLVIDRLNADEPHEYTRLIHFDPQVATHGDVTTGLRLEGPSFRGSLIDCSAVPIVEHRARGQLEPRLQGWAFPSYRKRLAADAYEITCQAAAVVLGFAVWLSETPAARPAVRVDGDTVRIDLPDETVSVAGSAKALAIAAS